MKELEDFDFDNLYKLVSDMNKSSKEKCLICHLPIEEKELQLSCSHQYHHNCLPKTNKCPYCQKPVTYNSNINNNNNIGCKIILKSGPKKGLECGRVKCGYHKINL